MVLMLPDNFVKYRDQFQLMSIVGAYRVYKRGSGDRVSYEIMKPIRIKGEMQLPGASFWGIYGWTCLNEKAVVEKILELVAQDKEQLDKQAGKLTSVLVVN